METPCLECRKPTARSGGYCSLRCEKAAALRGLPLTRESPESVERRRQAMIKAKAERAAQAQHWIGGPRKGHA